MHVVSSAELDRLVERLREARRTGAEVGFDFETSGPAIKTRNRSKPDSMRHLPVGFSWAFVDGERVYVPCALNRVLDFGDTSFGVDALAFRSRGLATLQYLTKPTPGVWIHNAKFEAQVLRNVGLRLHFPSVLDSLIAAHLTGWKLEGKGGLKLKALARVFLGHRGPDFDAVAQGRDAADIPIEELAPYGAEDAWRTLSLGRKARSEFDRLKLHKQWALDRRAVPVTAHMERTGVTPDAPKLLEAAAACEAEMVGLAARFMALTTTTLSMPTSVREHKPCPHPSHPCDEPGCMNGMLYFKNGKPHMHTVTRPLPQRRGAEIGSDAQVSRWLFDELGWLTTVGHPRTEADERWSTKAEHLMPYAADAGPGGEAVRLRLRYQALRKYATTYTRGLVDLAAQSGDGKLHTSYNQAGTDTQRYSSSLPNLSNLPSSDRQALPWLADLPDIRAAFKPQPGWLVILRDYSQIELRLLAHYSQDPRLLAAYPAEGPGTDLHAELMAHHGCDRRSAKILRFSSMYRISAKRLAIKLSLGTNDWTSHTKASAQDSLDALWELYPGVPAYWDAAIAYAKEHGYATTLTGFKRPLRKWGKDDAWHTGTCAVNTPIQGSAGGILKMAIVELYELWEARGWLETSVNLVGTTYDEIIVEARPEVRETVEADMERIMVGVGKTLGLRVPLAVEGGYGENWSDAKK